MNLVHLSLFMYVAIYLLLIAEIEHYWLLVVCSYKSYLGVVFWLHGFLVHCHSEHQCQQESRGRRGLIPGIGEACFLEAACNYTATSCLLQCIMQRHTKILLDTRAGQDTNFPQT